MDHIFFWIVALSIIIYLSGCSALGIDLSEDRTIAIQKSPYLIVISGDLKREDQIFINSTIRQLANEKYIDHNFTAIKVGVIGSETEIKSISINNEQKAK